MGSSAIKPWLEAFVVDELEAVLEWKQGLIDLPSLKPDPDSRFTDDGSNFINSVAIPSGVSSIAVIHKVFTDRGEARLVLSDGNVLIHALVSSNVRSMLEAEMGTALEEGMTGDVFRIRAMQLLSTPVGTPGHLVQVYIEEIEYRYHLRKFKSEPTPVEHCPKVERLLARMNELRAMQYEDPDEAVDDASITSQIDDHITSDIETEVEHPHKSEHNLASQNVSFDGKSSTRQVSVINDIGTQEVEGDTVGSQPALTQIIYAMPPFAQPRASAVLDQCSPEEAESKTKALLSLFSAPSNASRKRASPPAARSRSDEITSTPKRVRLSSPLQVLDEEPVVRSPHSARPDEIDVDIELPMEQKAAPADSEDQARPQSEQDELMKIMAYGRYKIPRNQQTLLDRKESWLPSLPGIRFPEPNVPIEVLSAWNKQIQEQHALSAEPNIAEPEAKPVSNHEESESSSDSSDEEIPASQWSLSPPVSRPELPPDSSIEEDGDGEHSDMEVASPHALPIRESPLKVQTRSPRMQGHGNESIEHSSSLASPQTQIAPVSVTPRRHINQGTPARSVRNSAATTVPQSTGSVGASDGSSKVSKGPMLSQPAPSLNSRNGTLSTTTDPAESRAALKARATDRYRQRRAWFLSKYRPSLHGTIHLSSIVDHYQHEHSDDAFASQDALLSTAGGAFGSDYNITADTTYVRVLPGRPSSSSSSASIDKSQRTAPLRPPTTLRHPLPPRPHTPLLSSNRPPESGQRTPPVRPNRKLSSGHSDASFADTERQQQRKAQQQQQPFTTSSRPQSQPQQHPIPPDRPSHQFKHQFQPPPPPPPPSQAKKPRLTQQDHQAPRPSSTTSPTHRLGLTSALPASSNESNDSHEKRASMRRVSSARGDRGTEGSYTMYYEQHSRLRSLHGTSKEDKMESGRAGRRSAERIDVLSWEV